MLKKLSSLDSWRWGLVRAETLAWERYFCVETRRAALHDGAIVPPEAVRYEPLPWRLVRRAVGMLALEKEDVFVDYGAGLGRALLMAARARVKRVLGVEWLSPLARSAMQNVLSARHRLRSPVKIIVADAARWEVPDDVTVAYLFNPFVGSVMRAVQARLQASLERRPRGLRVLYAHVNDQPDLFASCSWLTLRGSMGGGLFKDLTLSVYESPQSNWRSAQE